MKDLETVSKEFGRRLQAAMDAKGYTQVVLSEKTGISTSAISNYVNGRFVPNVYVLYVLCVSLGCTPNSLMGFKVKEMNE